MDLPVPDILENACCSDPVQHRVLGPSTAVLLFCLWMAQCSFSQPSVFLVLQWHTEMPTGVAVPVSSSPLRVMSATTLLMGQW